jgi:hypothetical protein
MKRVFILFALLVLGIASMASAGLTLAGPTTMPLGGTVTLQVIHDGSAAVVDGLDYATVYVPAANLTSLAMTSNMSAGGLSEIQDYLATYGYIFVIGANMPGENNLLAGTWVNFEISVFLPFWSVIPVSILYDGSTTTHNVTVIPEPMTICFLGLGGLFLRRRK